jgi:hypothetical protein
MITDFHVLRRKLVDKGGFASPSGSHYSDHEMIFGELFGSARTTVLIIISGGASVWDLKAPLVSGLS